MAVIVQRGRVFDGKQFYFRGDEIVSLSKKDEAELVASGACRWSEEGSLESDEISLLSVEDFAKMSAAEQKAELERCAIEPASNAADRVEQYTAWHNEQVAGHGSADV